MFIEFYFKCIEYISLLLIHFIKHVLFYIYYQIQDYKDSAQWVLVNLFYINVFYNTG